MGKLVSALFIDLIHCRAFCAYRCVLDPYIHLYREKEGVEEGLPE